MTRSTTTKPSRAAEILGSYLRERGETAHAFAKRAGVDYVYLSRALRGIGAERVTPNFAELIRIATDGVVPVAAWATLVN